MTSTSRPLAKTGQVPTVDEIPVPPDPVDFIQELLQGISAPVATLWCALELAAARSPMAEEDRQDLMTTYALVEKLALQIRKYQERADALYSARTDR